MTFEMIDGTIAAWVSSIRSRTKRKREINMKAPQVIFICAYVAQLVATFFLDGKPKRGTYSFLQCLASTISGVLLLWWGGFWSHS